MWLPKSWRISKGQNVLIFDFYWRLSQMLQVAQQITNPNPTDDLLTITQTYQFAADNLDNPHSVNLPWTSNHTAQELCIKQVAISNTQSPPPGGHAHTTHSRRTNDWGAGWCGDEVRASQLV